MPYGLALGRTVPYGLVLGRTVPYGLVLGRTPDGFERIAIITATAAASTGSSR